MTATKAVIIFCLVMFTLSGLGLWAGFKILPPEERRLAAASEAPGTSDLEKFWEEANYKKLRLAFLPFDLAGGLTRQNWQALPANNHWGIFCLWVTFGLILVLIKPR